jgi:small subunit ribosomal protein S15
MAITKEEKLSIFREFGKNAEDTGSSQVQAVILTKEITHLTGHCQKNPKDFSTRRGLLQKVCDRDRHLQYLKRTDVSKYREIVAKLGLRKYMSE